MCVFMREAPTLCIENRDIENGKDSIEHREKGDKEKRDDEREVQETVEQSTSLLYTPCLF